MVAIDIGNSYLKWKFWGESGEVLSSGSAVSDGCIETVFAFAAAYNVKKVVLSNVAQSAIEQQLRRVFSHAQFIVVKSTQQCLGVVNAYENVEKLGADRWIGIIEAYHLADKKAACVIDLGTAATLDIVDNEGRHQGGYIVPGLGLMRRALLQSTERVQVTADVGHWRGYGKNTNQAVEGGLHNLMLSWLNYEISQFWQNHAQGRVFITGGNAEPMAASLNDKRITVCKELLLDGLRRVALQ